MSPAPGFLGPTIGPARAYSATEWRGFVSLAIIAVAVDAFWFPSQYDAYSIALGPIQLPSMVAAGGGFFYLLEVAYFGIFASFALMSLGPLRLRAFYPYWCYWVFPAILAIAAALLRQNIPARFWLDLRVVIYSSAFVLAYSVVRRPSTLRRVMLSVYPIFGFLILVRGGFVARGILLGTSGQAGPLESRSGDFAMICAVFIITTLTCRGRPLVDRRMRPLMNLALVASVALVGLAVQYGVLVFLCVAGMTAVPSSKRQRQFGTVASVFILGIGAIYGSAAIAMSESWDASVLGTIAPSMYFTDLETTWVVYRALWVAGLSEWLREGVLFGAGWGATVVVPETGIIWNKEWLYVHNIYIELLMKGGLQMLLGALALFVSGYRHVRRSVSLDPTQRLLLGVVVGFLAMGVVHPFLGKVRLALLFWLCLGSLIGASSVQFPRRRGTAQRLVPDRLAPRSTRAQ